MALAEVETPREGLVLVMIVLREIRDGDELLLDYSDAFWHHHESEMLRMQNIAVGLPSALQPGARVLNPKP